MTCHSNSVVLDSNFYFIFILVHQIGLVKFIREVSEKGKVEHFIVHARKAVLNAKFSPDMNRRIPPLKYDYVYDLIKDFPHLQVIGWMLQSQVKCDL